MHGTEQFLGAESGFSPSEIQSLARRQLKGSLAAAAVIALFAALAIVRPPHWETGARAPGKVGVQAPEFAAQRTAVARNDRELP